MPTYEYVCKRCEQRFERFQNITDAPLRECPACGGRVERQIGTGAGLLIKGKGSGATGRSAEVVGERPSCGRDRPCCGRAQRCDRPGCES